MAMPQLGKSLPKKPKAKEVEEPPDVEVGDEMYFRHPQLGPLVGRIASRGQHGCHIDSGNRRHKVLYENLLGHKKRLRPEYTVIDDGEDGMIAEEPGGRRRFIHDPDVRSSDTDVKKSLPMFLIFGDNDVLMKAVRPGLSLQNVTDKMGNQTKRWKRTSKDLPAQKKTAAKDEAGADRGYGTHDIGRGDTVQFSTGDFKGEGKVVGKPGKQGAHVRDAAGQVHQVHWHEITKLDGAKPAGKDAKPKKAQPGGAGTPRVLGEQKPIPADQFDAASYAKSHDDGQASADSIMSQFPASTRKRAADAQKRLKTIEQTIDAHKKGEDYAPAREKLHQEIYAKMLSPEKIAAALPPEGEKPTFTALGGRGGSGKSSLKGLVYDDKKAIVLDSDAIKEMLPEYEGWNAAQVHEESGDIMDRLAEMARDLGLNVVVDATMKTADTALERVQAFKAAGYKTAAHYMHVPRQVAAHRAVERFVGKKGRYVPVDVVLGNRTNESSFDQVRKQVDSWSFWDNNVPKGTGPIKISESGENATSKENAENGDLKPDAEGGK